MIILLNGVAMDYAWGGYDFIRDLCGETGERSQPRAELWFGDHANAPAIAHDGDKRLPLNQWLAQHDQAPLPFLLKILDVRLPLSIQVHPNKVQAQAGFAREEAAGVALDAPQRLYKDANHKPEMMVALSEFWLLHGFADAATIDHHLSLHDCLQEPRRWFAEQPLASAYAQVMQADSTQLANWLLPLLDAPMGTQLDSPLYWLQYTQQAMSIPREQLDPGLMCFLLFNLVHLQPGEALIQLARLPHAYLRGQNIEIMAASDNVLRAGLTPKHVAIDELLRIIDPRSVQPEVMSAQNETPLMRYPSHVADFSLATITLERGRAWSATLANTSIVLARRGAITLHDGLRTCHAAQGQAVLVLAGSRVEAHCVGAKADIVVASGVATQNREQDT